MSAVTGAAEVCVSIPSGGRGGSWMTDVLSCRSL